MRRHLRWVGWVVLQAAVAGCSVDPAGPDGAVDDPATGGPELVGKAIFAPGEVTERWFVELHEPSRARGGAPTVLGHERLLFQRATVSLGLRYKERLSFERLWNGLSVEVAEGGADVLASMPEVKAIYPVVPIELDDATPGSGSEPDLYTGLAMSGADIVHSQLGYTGEGVRVGVIDSGIDIDHPDFGGCFGPGCRVAYGHDLVGDAYNADDSSTQPVPDAIPDDCGGHGTHVAGIIGANGVIVGVAPDVTLGAYRIFGCSGTTSSDVIIQAMEMAEADEMRVINMSIGAPFQWPSYPTAVAANQLVENGVVVVTSIGNSGANGVWAAGAPGVGARVIGTAAIENTAITSLAFGISDSGAPDVTLFGFKKATGAPLPPVSGSMPMARTGTPATLNDACAALPAGSMTGQIVLISRGGCPFNQKAANAQAAGAAGVVIYNNISGTLTPSVTPAATTPTVITIPVTGITLSDGALINARMDLGLVTLSWTNQLTSPANPQANLVSTFSSYGMAADLSMKPDIAAPGGNIWSTYPLERGGYESLGGTSMASPHVAGSVALLLEARPGIPAPLVRDILQNSAVPGVWSGDVAAGIPDHTFRQGAGMVRSDRAILETTIITPGKLSLGESEAGPFGATLTLTNEGTEPVAYELSHVAAKSVGSDHWTPAADAAGFASVEFSAPVVSVPAGGAATVDVTITADGVLSEGSLYGGYLVFTQQGGPSVLRVPYAGYKGDYQAMQVLTPTASGYPWLALRSGTTYTNKPNGGAFTLQGADLPSVVVHYDHHAARVTIDAYEATTMKPYGRVRDLRDVGQSSTKIDATAYSVYTWNGQVTLNKKTSLIPNGKYVLKLRVLKALGHEANPAHWETWTSPVVTINHL